MCIKKLDNYKILFCLRILKNILSSFLDVFLVLYFLTVSNNNILPIGIYKLVSMSTVFLVIFLLRDLSKSEKRINLLRTGMVLYFIYFLAIIILKEKVVDYVYLIGFLYGLEEGFYYSVYNMIESDGVDNKDRAKYTGSFIAIKNVMSIIFPIIFGSLIKQSGFVNTTVVALIIVALQIILSGMFKDNNIPKANRTNFKKFNAIAKKHKELKDIITTKICCGLTYSGGALSYVITIYIIKVFSESVSLGIFTSIFSAISAIIGILFVKVIKPKHYNTLILSTSSITIVLLSIMLLKCNFLTIVLYNLFQTISKELSDLIIENNITNFSNIRALRKEYKSEYFICIEASLFIGRVISNVLFIIMAFTDANIILGIFIIFAIMQAANVIKLQNSIGNCKEVNKSCIN